MASTVVGLFDSRDEARQAQEELIHAGFNDQDVSLVAQPSTDPVQDVKEIERDPGFWDNLKRIFGAETPREETEYYIEGTRRGGTIVAVNAPEDRIDRAVDILQSHHAVDIDRRAEQWRQSGWHGYQPGAQPMAGPDLETERARDDHGKVRESMPVIQEELAAGKRAVDRGGVRIYRRVTERPVEEKIELREERVDVERHPVDRPVTGAEAGEAFTEKVIEARETAEEPVISKEARVVEEVELRKDVKQREETVRDTVRRSDVEVERIPGEREQRRTEPPPPPAP